jgi:surface carbohydrate biosynthesis protein (TIGR04326 family)
MTENNRKENTIIVSELEEGFQHKDSHVLNWSSYFCEINKNIHSLPRFIDKNKETFKSKYLELIFSLGESKVDEKSIVDFLEIRPNFSYWWMTLLSEKCNAIKSPQINNAIKLLAFENWFFERHYNRIFLKSSNKELAEAFQILSNKLGIKFEWEKLKEDPDKKWKKIHHKFPLVFQAFSWFCIRLIKRWNLKGAGISEWKNSSASTTVFSFLFNLPSDSVSKGIFKSSHWTVLPDEFIKHNVATNWLHLFNPDKIVPTSKLARKLIIKFNKNQNNKQVHVTLDSFLSFKMLISTLLDWSFLIKSYMKVSVHMSKTSGFLWPLIRSDYKSSMLGPEALENLLNLNLFQQALSCLPSQEKGFYLQENQGWEYSLISAWRSSNHGKNLFGIPHSTIRYWDLRYFFDKRSYNAGVSDCSLPLPDYIGVNGIRAKEMYILSGYPEDKILEVEALRYQYLNEIVMFTKISNHNILVLGGKNIKNQMKLLNSVDSFLHESIKFTIKTDAWNPIKLNDLQKNRMELTTDSMSTLLSKHNVVYTDNITSAGVDAYCLGKKVISMLDPSMLNLSPLLDHEDVLFVSSPEQFSDALNNFSSLTNIKREFFYLDSNLTRWEKLINGEKFS